VAVPQVLPRPVEEVAVEIEQQARAVADRPQAAPQVAGEVLARWLEQSSGGGPNGGFLLLASADPSSPSSAAGGERVFLGFREALLRSRAFELLLDVGSRVPPLRAALQCRGSGSEGPSALVQSLGQVAEQILLPGSLRLWPGLLEALLADGDAKGAQGSQPTGAPSAPSVGKARKGPGSLRWEQWGRRVLAALKRGWQSESLSRVLNHLDHRLSDLAGGQAFEKAEHVNAGAGTEDIWHGSAGGRLSKQGIRAALAREKLRERAGEAGGLRLRSELLCGACARLAAAVSGGAARAPKLERLLADADDAMASLDEGVKLMHSEQESLSGSLSELGGELQRQMTSVQMTRQAFAEKRGTLQDERKALLRRLEELDLHMAQLQQEENGCIAQERQLREQLQTTTAHYEKMIASAIQEQQSLADEKLRAVAYKECAHMALDVVRAYVGSRGVELAEQLRRRRAELKRTLAQYLKVERLRIEAAGECLDGVLPHKPGGATAASGAGTEASELEAAADEAWNAAQRVLRKAEAALGTNDAEASPPAAEAANEGPEPGAASPTAAVAAGEGTSPGPEADATQEAGEGGGQAVAEGASARQPEDAREVFARAGEQQCVDCGSAGAEWASVSHGTYLCTECAGRHRGLGVHLSFVRSTTMDRWRDEHLRRMQLGGNARFREFLSGYPRLSGPVGTTEELTALYSSRAAAFYRRRLSSLCEGRAAQQESAPPVEEGHLEATSGDLSPDGGPVLLAGGNGEDNSLSNDDGEASGSLAQERQALKAARADFQQRLEQRRGVGAIAVVKGDAGVG